MEITKENVLQESGLFGLAFSLAALRREGGRSRDSRSWGLLRGWGGTVNEDNQRAWEHWLGTWQWREGCAHEVADKVSSTGLMELPQRAM